MEGKTDIIKLLTRLKVSDAEAFSSIFEMFHRQVYSFCCKSLSLVKKLLDDRLSASELNELHQFFRQEKAQGEVKLWLDDLWKESNSQKTVPVDSAQMLKLLNERREALIKKEKTSRLKMDSE